MYELHDDRIGEKPHARLVSQGIRSQKSCVRVRAKLDKRKMYKQETYTVDFRNTVNSYDYQ